MIEIDDCIPCWPFLVHRFFITEHKTINDDISKRLYEISKEEEGKIYSNYKGYHSNDLKHENCMKPLTEAAIPMALGKIISDFQMEKNITGEFGIGIWGNLNNPNSYNKPHLHTNSHLSGIYYVKIPKDSGRLCLYNPNQYHDLDPFMNQNLYIIPKEGDIYIWRSDVVHDVEINNSKEDRISVAFNIHMEIQEGNRDNE